MKKHLLFAAVALMGATSSFAQTVQTVDRKAQLKEMTRQATQMQVKANPSQASASDMKAGVRKAYADGVLMMRPEGTFYNSGRLSDGSSFSSVLMPPFTDFTFYNLCQDRENAVWTMGGEPLEDAADAEFNYTDYIPKGTSINSLWYAPAIQVGSTSFSLVDFIQPVDSALTSFYYMNTTKSGFYYSSTGSPLGTEQFEFDLDGDNVPDQAFQAGIRQIFAEKPIQPLVLHDLYLPFFSNQDVPLPEGQTLKCVIRRLTTSEEEGQTYLNLADTLATMEVTNADVFGGEVINGAWKEFGVVFANYTEDEFGTLTPSPIIIDDMFAVEIWGFDGQGVNIQTFYCDQAQDEAEFYTNNARATYMLVNNAQGEYQGQLRYYGRLDAGQSADYCYNTIFVMEGEMDGLMVSNFGTQIAPVEGGESGDAEEQSAAYVMTNFPIYDVDAETQTAEFAYNYDIEGIPDWAEIRIDPSYYENEQYTNVRGLNMMWFNVEALPAGEKGRSALVSIVSMRDAKCKGDLILLQGDAEVPSGVKAIQFDKDGKFLRTYNMKGQAVSNNTKGLIIKNGKKFFNK